MRPDDLVAYIQSETTAKGTVSMRVVRRAAYIQSVSSVCPSVRSVCSFCLFVLSVRSVRSFCPFVLSVRFVCLSALSVLPCRHVQSHPSGTFGESCRPMRRPRWGGPGIRCEAGRRRPVARRWSSDADVRMRMCGRRDAETRWRGAVAPAGDVREPGLGIGEPGHWHRCANSRLKPPGAVHPHGVSPCIPVVA